MICCSLLILPVSRLVYRTENLSASSFSVLSDASVSFATRFVSCATFAFLSTNWSMRFLFSVCRISIRSFRLVLLFSLGCSSNSDRTSAESCEFWLTKYALSIVYSVLSCVIFFSSVFKFRINYLSICCSSESNLELISLTFAGASRFIACKFFLSY